MAAAELTDIVEAEPITPDGVRARRLQLVSMALAVVVVDQVTKFWALDALQNSSIEGPFGTQLRLVYNTGSAFSLGSGYGPLFGALALLVAISLFWIVRTVDRRAVVLGLGLVQGGAIGNVLDRLFREGRGGNNGFLRGAVIDFLEMGDWWPVFNIADVAIVVGGVIVVLFGSRA